MDLDPTLRGGLEMGLKICPMKTSSQNPPRPHHRRIVSVGVSVSVCVQTIDDSTGTSVFLLQLTWQQIQMQLLNHLVHIRTVVEAVPVGK